MTNAIYTIGHSTTPIADFIAVLNMHCFEEVVDVRRFPGSRRHPQFGTELLDQSLNDFGVAYRHVIELGGRRKPAQESRNTGWKSASFRAYADYMETPAFGDALEQLVIRAATVKEVIMCAEAVPWRCHRRLISDALVARGIQVWHIIGVTTPTAHTLSPFARICADGTLAYPAPDM